MRRITCSQLEPWLELYVDHELEPWMVAIVQAHLGECSKCSHVVHELRAVDKAVQDWAVSELPEDRCDEALALAQLLSAQAAMARDRDARASILSGIGSGAKRLGLTPGSASRALVSGAAFSGRILLRGVRLAAGTVTTIAKPQETGRGRPHPSLSARTATTAGRYVARAAVAGARWVGREALSLG